MTFALAGGAPLSGHVDMLSAPTARPTSIAPAVIWLEMFWMARRPDEQNRLATDAADEAGNPAARMEERATYPGEGARTFPRQTSSIRDGSMFMFSRTDWGLLV